MPDIVTVPDALGDVFERLARCGEFPPYLPAAPGKEVMPTRRYLVVANQTLGSRPLADEVRRLMTAGPSRFHLVVPATDANHHLTWTEGDAVAIAAHHLADALDRLRAIGADVDGEVGDGRPMDAVGDAIRSGPPYDAIILSTLPPGVSRWLRQDLPHRLERAYGLPVIHVVGKVQPVG